MVGMQANTVLQGMYTSKVQAHLQAQEEDKKAKQKKQKKFMGDGMPRLCDADNFFNHIVKIEQEMEREAEEKEGEESKPRALSTRRALYAIWCGGARPLLP
jgi:hypothetical protein